MQKELKVDMDWRPPESWLGSWFIAAEQICESYLNSIVQWHTTKTKHGFHIRGILETPIPDKTALFLQFLLGDDRVRCKLNYGRWKAGIKDWNKLWKCKVGRDK